LYATFAAKGFGALVEDQPEKLANYLEECASETGFAAPLFLACMIRNVDCFFHEHDSYGGVRVDFIATLDQSFLPDLARMDIRSAKAARAARDLLNEMRSLLRDYRPDSNS
jgi:hypothetical protein